MKIKGNAVRLPLLLAMLLLLSLLVGMVGAQGETRQLSVGSPTVATLDETTFAQTYWFDGVTGQQVTIFATTEVADLGLALLLTDAEGNLLLQDTDPETLGAAALSGFSVPADGRYYVTVFRLDGAQGQGTGEFTVTFVSDETAAIPAAGGDTAPITSGSPLVTLNAGMQVDLSWTISADLDLEIRDPLGNSVYWDNPTAGNAVFDRNVNANCAVVEDPALETITFTPGALSVGSYEVIVYYTQGCEDNSPADLTLDIIVDGQPVDTVAGTLLPGQEFLTSFVVTASGEAAVGAGGPNPGNTLGDTATFLTGQLPLAAGESVTGRIDGETVYEAYSFEGVTGDIVSLRMDAVDGNLDAKVYLLDPAGNVVAVNDDAVNADTTNAAILNQTLVSDGTYSAVTTRYGQDYGGTEGAYSLTLTGGEFDVPPALAGLDLPAGSVEIALLWNTNADLQLLVRDPSGNAVYDDIPVGNSGGILAENGNVNCAAPTTSPISYVYWPADRLPPGTYEVEVWYQSQCNDISPVTFNLTTRINDEIILSANEQPIPGQVYLTNFTVDVNGNASAGAGGFIGDSSTLDVGAELPGATMLSYGDTISGTINQTNKLDVYTFEGEAGDQVRVGMDATAGTLDTTLFLLSPDGAQLAANDDAVVNETTNSLIDQFTLPADGTYIIIATHYGGLYGGTSGTYNLSVVQLN